MRRWLVCVVWLGFGMAIAPAQFSISLGVKPSQLKFEFDELKVPAGEEVRLTFLNNGIMPHNFVLCAAGREDAVIEAAGKMNPASAAERGWVPDSKDVLAHTTLVQGGEQAVINFQSPKTPGKYVYLCCYPGHWFVMRGTLTVVDREKEQPAPVTTAFNLKAPADNLTLSTVQPKPIGTRTQPFVIRTFMPDPGLAPAVFQFHHQGHPASKYSPNAGKDVNGTVNPIHGLPAAFGVSHGNDLSYCWDTVECKLLYAWVGGFLDMTPYWGGGTGGGRKGFGYVPTIIGRVVHQSSTAGPLATDRVKFHGFRLEQGVPVFRYQRAGFEIEERIEPAGGSMLQSLVLDSPNKRTAAFEFTEQEKSQLQVSAGTWEENTLRVPVDGKTLVAFTWKIPEPPPPPPPPPPPKPVMVDSTDGVLKSLTRGKADKQARLIKGGLKKGGTIYGDREYHYAKVPERLRGADIVQTFNNDKKAAGTHYAFALAKPGRVVLLNDTRHGAPPRLDGKAVFRKTGETVTTDFDFEFHVFEAELPAGDYRFDKQNDMSHFTFTAFATPKKESDK